MPIAIMLFSLLALAFSIASTGEIFYLNSDFSRFSSFKYGVCTCESKGRGGSERMS